jgi:hypothetical protein
LIHVLSGGLRPPLKTWIKQYRFFKIGAWCDMTSYSTDFYAWTIEQADRLKTQQWQNLDIENLVEEIESLGRQERQQLTHRFGILLGHLLKWQYQPSYRSNSWQAMIREHRRRILRLLEENPSLQPFLSESLELGYEDGVDLAIQETNLPVETFPTACPYTLNQALDAEFLPDLR